MTTISGELVYRERIALIPGGTASITVSEASAHGVAESVIAQTTIELDDQQIPIPFELTVDPVDPGFEGSYAVAATISGPDDHLEWVTEAAHLVDLDGADIEVGALMLVQAVRNGPNVASASPIRGRRHRRPTDPHVE